MWPWVPIWADGISRSGKDLHRRLTRNSVFDTTEFRNSLVPFLLPKIRYSTFSVTLSGRFADESPTISPTGSASTRNSCVFSSQ